MYVQEREATCLLGSRIHYEDLVLSDRSPDTGRRGEGGQYVHTPPDMFRLFLYTFYLSFVVRFIILFILQNSNSATGQKCTIETQRSNTMGKQTDRQKTDRKAH